ncbi:unnamed protein product, partial [Cylicostephanus goldi]
MEMRLSADTSSGSFDKTKAERFAAMTSPVVKQEDFPAPSKYEEIYEGRAYGRDDFVEFGVGYFKDDTFYVSPVSGTFEMHRSLSHLNNASKGRDNEGEDGESDGENPGGSGQQVIFPVEAIRSSIEFLACVLSLWLSARFEQVSFQIRVKFSRPETERQKKRREASALHREKLIASD